MKIWTKMWVNTVYVRTGTSVYKCEWTQCMYVPVRPSTNVSVNTVYVRTGTSVYKCEWEHSVCTYRYVRLQMWVGTQCMYVPVRPSTKSFPQNLVSRQRSMSATWRYAMWTDPRSRSRSHRSKSYENGWFHQYACECELWHYKTMSKF